MEALQKQIVDPASSSICQMSLVLPRDPTHAVNSAVVVPEHQLPNKVRHELKSCVGCEPEFDADRKVSCIVLCLMVHHEMR